MASLENRTQILNIDAEAANENAAPNYTVATAWTDSKGDAVTTFEEDKAYTLTATLTAKAVINLLKRVNRLPLKSEKKMWK